MRNTSTPLPIRISPKRTLCKTQTTFPPTSLTVNYHSTIIENGRVRSKPRRISSHLTRYYPLFIRTSLQSYHVIGKDQRPNPLFLLPRLLLKFPPCFAPDATVQRPWYSGSFFFLHMEAAAKIGATCPCELVFGRCGIPIRDVRLHAVVFS